MAAWEGAAGDPIGQPVHRVEKGAGMCDGVVRRAVELMVASVAGVAVAAEVARGETDPCVQTVDLLLALVESAETDRGVIADLLDSIDRCGELEPAAVARAIQVSVPLPISTPALDPCGNLLGDLNTDGQVNGADYPLFLLSWGPCSGCVADLDNDGYVGAADLVLLLLNWGETLHPGDVNGDRRVNTQDVVILFTSWGPCAGCPADLNHDGVANATDLVILLTYWGIVYPMPDRQYLYEDIQISVFGGPAGPTFTAARSDGLVLRQNYANEAFVADNSNGALAISYEIIEQCAGVDIVYTVGNPSGVPHPIPNFELHGIRQAITGDVFALNPAQSGTVEPLDLTMSTSFNWPYARVYSPVLVTHDGEFAVGTSLIFPQDEYHHSVRLRLEKVVAGSQSETWRHRYKYEPSDVEAVVPPGETRTYTMSVRFGPPRYWLLTLYPYRDFFQGHYGAYSDERVADRRPIMGSNVSNHGDYDPLTNPRGYNVSLGIHTDGWGPYVASTLELLQQHGVQRLHLWAPSGTYHNPDGCPNFPPQFMDFLPHLEATDFFFDLFALNGYELGFWWGRSVEIPYGFDEDGWDPEGCEDVEYFTDADISFMTGQLVQALDRGAQVIGLDAFPTMSAWKRSLWVDYLKAMAAGVLFIHEPAGPDFLHAKIGNYYAPHGWGRPTQPGPDLLSRYLGNGDSEIWVRFKSDTHTYTQQDLQDHIRWGFTPITLRLVDFDNFDVSALDYTLVECIDGQDNDGDGLVDFPYDPGCECAADDSE